ncbi:hypothetical protein GCM10010398_48600 [Streptomyces fimbriatus]
MAMTVQRTPGTTSPPSVSLVRKSEPATWSARDGTTHRVTAGDTVIVNPGATLAVENPTAEEAVSWVTTSHGLEATPADGTRIVPPWTG